MKGKPGMMNTRMSKTAMYLLRGAAIFAIFFFTRLLLYFATVGMAMQDSAQLYVDFPMWSIGLIVLIGSLFLYNSLVRLFFFHDAVGADAFFENPIVERRFAEYRHAFFDRDLIVTTLPSLLLLALLLPTGAFSEAELLFESIGSLRYPTMYAVYLSSFIFTAINSRYETRRHWLSLYEARDTDRIRGTVRFFLKGALIVLIYPFAVPLSPILVVLAINVFSILEALLGLFSTVGLGVTTALAIIFLIMLPKLRALAVRRSFKKRLFAVAERAGYDLSDVLSEKGTASGYVGVLSFTLKYKGREYNCRLVPIEHKRRPIYFTGENAAHFLIKIGTSKHFISLAKHFNYAPSGNGKSIVILSPEPKYVFVSSDGGEKRLFTGDKIWCHTVFEPDSFFGSMDRHCLDKLKGAFE